MTLRNRPGNTTAFLHEDIWLDLGCTIDRRSFVDNNKENKATFACKVLTTLWVHSHQCKIKISFQHTFVHKDMPIWMWCCFTQRPGTFDPATILIYISIAKCLSFWSGVRSISIWVSVVPSRIISDKLVNFNMCPLMKDVGFKETPPGAILYRVMFWSSVGGTMQFLA